MYLFGRNVQGMQKINYITAAGGNLYVLRKGEQWGQPLSFPFYPLIICAAVCERMEAKSFVRLDTPVSSAYAENAGRTHADDYLQAADLLFHRAPGSPEV